MRLHPIVAIAVSVLAVAYARDVRAQPSSRRSPSASARVSRLLVSEDRGWKFSLNPAGSPEKPDYDDSAWLPVDLPQSWNGVDAASTSYATGDGWYRKTIAVNPSLGGRQIYLRFDGASIVTTLFVDGNLVPFAPSIDGPRGVSHEGAFQTFIFDVTRVLTPGAHVVAVRVNNANHADIAPAAGGDYSKSGGLYRGVTLMALNPVHVAADVAVPREMPSSDPASHVATNGVSFSHAPVRIGSPSVAVTMTAIVDNDSTADRRVRVTSELRDASGHLSARAETDRTLPAGAAGVVVTGGGTVSRPHVWDGRIDPYLYALSVRVEDAVTGALLDVVRERVGIRTVAFNANPDPGAADPASRSAFMLNGHPYSLVGVDVHQDSGRPGKDGRPVGWAQSDADIRADATMIADVGATVVRTSHYQDAQAFYDACDRAGILVYTESPVNGSTNASPAFLMNAEDQYAALILQNIDHPSVLAWGLGNETADSPVTRVVFGAMNTLAHRLDPSRPTGLASNGGRLSTTANVDGIPDIKGTHPYDYWYGANVPIQKTHDAFPAQPLGVTEFGGGGSAYQYSRDTFTLPVARGLGTAAHFHPANQQTLIEETQFTDLSGARFLWGRILWQMFDMASSVRDEGDHAGTNDKGIATRDRVRKDAFYFYQATWNDPDRNYASARVLRISDRFWTSRTQPSARVTAFSNVGAPALTLNGKAAGTMTPLVVNGHTPAGDVVAETVPNVYVADVSLQEGDNRVSVRSAFAKDHRTYSDSVVWTYRTRLRGTPVARVDFVPAGARPASGYVADEGAPFAAHGSTAYGWTAHPGTAFGAGQDASETGLNLWAASGDTPSPVWEYALPNGVYDVRIGAGQPDTRDSINQFALEGHPATVDDDGPDAKDVFFASVRVRDGRLTLSLAPGAFNARVTFIDINRVDVPVR